MTNSNNLALFIDNLLEKNCPFALWVMPGSKSPEIIISDRENIIYPVRFEKLNGGEGFVFAPFTISTEAPLLLLKPGIYKKGVDDILNLDLSTLPAFENDNAIKNNHYIISREEYLEDINKAIDTIKKTRLAKVIVSRLIPQKRENESIGKIFIQLYNQTPNAMTYLVHLPSDKKVTAAGMWMGATPEVLLKSTGRELETVSLAGTQSRRDDDDYSWHTKEIEEQAFVSRYLLDIFYKFNIYPYTTQGPETLESGHVAHLSTIFRFAAKKLATNLGNFIAELHPTPAVCGYPKSKAAMYIPQIEKHSRKYYTGYLGPWRLNGEVSLFVNLRCMEILPEEYILYSGGGITSRSVPEDEWEETNKKATTLLSAIEAVQNK